MIQPLSEIAQKLPLGIYKHFKGHVVRVLGVARDSESGAEMVVYQKTANGDLWVRPIDMFLETVDRDGVVQPRFQYVGEVEDK